MTWSVVHNTEAVTELIRSWFKELVRTFAVSSSFPLGERIALMGLKLLALIGYSVGKSSAVSMLPAHKITTTKTVYKTSALLRKPPLSVSIVIPALVRSDYELAQLKRAVQSAFNQILDANIEALTVIVIDDGSPVHIKTCLDNRAQQASRRLIVHSLLQNRGPANARNVGIKLSQSIGIDVVCLMDADCIAPANWASSMVSMQMKRPGIVCGKTRALQPIHLVSAYHDLFGTLNGRMGRDGSLIYGCTCNMSFMLQLFAADFEFFDTTFPSAAYEDVEFCIRARNRGIGLEYAPDAVIFHDYNLSVFGFFRQFRRYGREEFRMLTRHPDFMERLEGSKEIPSYFIASI
jgi:glycosyltransferase involved in cell wall biosynthesis